MRVVRENTMSTIVNITRKTCAAGVFVIHASSDQSAINVVAAHLRWQKALRADSESRFLAIKKFSCITASRLIVARQTRFFVGIAATDSQRDSSSAARVGARGAWLMHARSRVKRRHADHADGTPSDIQMPSLDLSRSFTACGLALPPDDFITCPTNQPISCGLARACATLSGLADMMLSTTFSIALRSVTCFMFRRSAMVLTSTGSATGPISMTK